MFLLSMPVFVATAVAMAVCVVATVGAFILFHRLFPMAISEELKNAASWGGRRIGVVHALILALVFADVRQEYNELGETIENEALAIEQLYRELGRIDSDEARAIQQQLVAYVRIVVDQEWESLASDRLLTAADVLVSDIRQNLVDLPAEQAPPPVSAALMDDINDIENMRGQRSLDTAQPVATIFWIIIVLGFIFTTLCFFTFNPRLAQCVLLAMFAAMNGAVFYSIIALTHPFEGGAAVSPTPFKTVYERIVQLGYRPQDTGSLPIHSG